MQWTCRLVVKTGIPLEGELMVLLQGGGGKFVSWGVLSLRGGWKTPALNKGQDHSFWYQSISRIRATSYRLSNNFCSKTHRLATIRNVTDDDNRRRT